MNKQVEFKHLFVVLIESWLKIIALGIIFGAFAFGYTKISANKSYRSNVEIMITQKKTKSDFGAINPQQAYTLNVGTSRDLIKSGRVLNSVVRDLKKDGESLTSQSIKQSITVENNNNSQVIIVGVEGSSPVISKKVANAIGKEFVRTSDKLLVGSSSEVITRARKGSVVSSSSKKLLLFAVAMGMIAGYIWGYVADYRRSK